MIKRGKFAWAGSASNRIGHKDSEEFSRGRMNGHANESKKYPDKSYFYNYHPDENYTQASKSLKEAILNT